MSPTRRPWTPHRRKIVRRMSRPLWSLRRHRRLRTLRPLVSPCAAWMMLWGSHPCRPTRLAGVCPDATAEVGSITVLSDSRAAIGTASNPPNRNAWHFLLGQSFVQSALAFRLILLKHVTTETQYADALTKAPTPLFLQLLQQLMRGRADMPLAAKIYK